LCPVKIYEQAEGCEPLREGEEPAVRATLDYLRGFYLARLRLVKTRRQKDVRAYGKAGSLAASP